MIFSVQLLVQLFVMCCQMWPCSSFKMTGETDFITITDKLWLRVCHRDHNKSRGACHSSVFHKTIEHKVLANLICLSQYFQKQRVSPSAKQWERPQDNKIRWAGLARWSWGGGGGGCAYDERPYWCHLETEQAFTAVLNKSEFMPCQA